MLKKKFIVISRSFGDASSIKALREPFNDSLTFDVTASVAEAIKGDLVKQGVKPRAANQFAQGVLSAPVGFIHHAPDAPDAYYRILGAHFTSNRVPITPGLRVRDYDQRKGEVTAHQFMADSPMAPGGEYHDGWYYVEANGFAQRYSGSKLVAL